MINLTTENIREHLKEVTGIYGIRFYSPTCGPCHTMKPVFDLLEQNNPSVRFFEVDSSSSQEISSHYNIRGVPALLFCLEADVIYSFSGVTPLIEIQNVLNQLGGEPFKKFGLIEPLPKEKSYFIYWSLLVIVIVYGIIWVLSSKS